jgi:MIP family channel proteins
MSTDSVTKTVGESPKSKEAEALQHQATKTTTAKYDIFLEKIAYVERRLLIRNDTARLFMAEFLGTYVLMILGLSSIAQSVLSRSALGEFLSINLGWGLAVAMGVWVSGSVSGGHLNPAVSFGMVFSGRMTWAKLPIYWLAQYLAAFFGALCIYSLYHEALNDFDGGVRSVAGPNGTAGIFANYPQPYLSASSAFGDQVLGTMMLMLLVMAMTDTNSTMRVSEGFLPLGVAAIITVIGLGLGLNCGYPINPARDFSPRLFTAVAGWGAAVFTNYNHFWWVPVLAPHIGAVCGAWIYRLMVGIHQKKIRRRQFSICTCDEHLDDSQWRHLQQQLAPKTLRTNDDNVLQSVV